MIDDTAGIHDDFRKIFARPSAVVGGLDATAAALFGPSTRSPAESAEFTIESSYQGQDGVERIRCARAEGRPVSLAFVDMRMPPGWDGLETVRQLWKVDPRVQIVVCTAHSDYSWETIHSTLGPTDSLIILKKPFDHIEARQLAHTLCRKWFLAREIDARLSRLDDLIHERTRELGLAEARFSMAFAANPHAQALIALDPFSFLEVNAAFTRQFGLSTADLVSQTPESFGRAVDPRRWRLLLTRLLAGEEIDEYPFTFERTPGVRRDLCCSARAVTIAGRRASIWMVRDATDERRPAEPLRPTEPAARPGPFPA